MKQGVVVTEEERVEDLDTADVVARFQAGEAEAFNALYLRYFDRVYAYLRLVLRDPHEAEDLAQQSFLEAFEALPRYEHRGQPFRAWLFTIVRNRAVSHWRKHGRLDVEDVEQVNRRRERPDGDAGLYALGWVSDTDLLTFIEHMPPVQRQVIVLRYMLDLAPREIAAVMGRSPEAIRMLQHRAIAFLRARLVSIGREPQATKRAQSQTVLRKSRVIRVRRYSLSNPGPTG